MSQKLKPQNANIPWLALFEFPCHADAKAFAEMAEEQFGDKAIVRKKNVVFKQGAFAGWRTTTAVRTALQGRSFTNEMVGETLADHGYSGTVASANAWLYRAVSEGVIERIEPGLFEFPRASKQPVIAFAPKCAACQPEPIQCYLA